MGWNQLSYSTQEGKGCLYLVPTPIGNLQDMTFRAIDTLKRVDYIAAEDTRQTKKILFFYQIEKPLISYHEHNKERKGDSILADLKDGKQVALVTDAGMPGISDPGEDIARLAIEAQIPVISLPGANAAITALVASGVSTKRFQFYGFLDRGKKKKEEELEALKYNPDTLIFYEAPHRLKETLQVLHKAFGDRKGAIVREISKKHEEYIRGDIQDLIHWSQTEMIRGEFCLIIEGNQNKEEIELAAKTAAEPAWWQSLSIVEHVDKYVEQGEKSKEAIKKAAIDRDVPKRDVYQAYHIEE
jgi:16S rRNA (cytidine1402-2'-O)-methyltransferase